ncbi:MAG: hypothetical protein LBO75_03230 [Bifidobacteriaceae bacterium]|jgi:hypothetical protein|nr:hypothetical protein [Bifidobacteriaceae bacterium]
MGQPRKPGGAAEQETAAKSYYDCLTEAGLPAVLEPQRDGQAWVGFDTDHPVIQCDSEHGCGVQANGKVSDEVAQVLQTRLAELEREAVDESGELVRPVLWIGDQDYSEGFSRCLSLSGYRDPEPVGADLTEESESIRRKLDAGVKWAVCARENGFPEIADPFPPDGQEPSTREAVVLLPYDITEDQLRALVEACPPFDVNAHRLYDESLEDGTDDMVPVIDPRIEIALPGGPDSDPTPEEAERIERLTTILGETEETYMDEESSLRR